MKCYKEMGLKGSDLGVGVMESYRELGVMESY